VAVPAGRSVFLARPRRAEGPLPPADAAAIAAVPGVDVLWSAGPNALLAADGLLPDAPALHGLKAKALSTGPRAAPRRVPVPSDLGRVATFTPFIDAMVAEVDSIEYFQWIKNLAGGDPVVVGGSPVTFQTRHTLQAQCRLAEQYAYEQFLAMGFTDVQYQTFTVAGTTTRNVIATLPGQETPDQHVLITGHLDSTSGSPALAPGANDNASGSAVVLAAAEIMRTRQFRSTLKFVLFTGEEQGLHGSEHYAAAAFARGDDILGVVNCDMVAYWNTNYGLEIESRSFAEPLMFLLRDACLEYTDFGTKLFYTAWGSDHVPFLDLGYPAVLAIEDDWSSYPYYHTVLDTWDRNDATFGRKATQVSIATAAYLAQEASSTAVVTPSPPPAALRLAPAAPNPFRNGTIVAFDLPEPANVDLAVYDLLGRRVRTLERRRFQYGPQESSWDGRSADGAPVPAGVYFLRLTAGGKSLQERVVRLR
jgi:hypothetical protein